MKMKSLERGLSYFLIPLVYMTGFPVASQVIQTLNYNNSLNFVSGTFAEYLEDPIFYETFVPLIYEFPLPKHNINAVKLMWDHATVCNASDSRYDGKLCPVVHHLHKLVANLSADMSFWKDFLPESFPESDLKSSSMKIVPHCDEISNHFSSYYTPQERIQAYLKYLEKCPFGQNIQIISQPYKNWIVDKSIYYTMLDRFYSQFYRNLPNNGDIDWVVTLNSYTAIQGILLSNNFMESSHLKHAITNCQEGLIPEFFIRTQMLQDALKTMKSKVYTAHFKYLWEKNGDLSMYYKLPLADCTFTDDYKLLVRVLIPVKAMDFDAKLLQLNTFPFIEKFPSKKGHEVTKTASPEAVKLCMLDTPGNIRMVESSSGLLFETTCKPNELCKSSEFNSFLPTDVCISAIVTNTEDLISKHCPVKCFDINRKSLPIIRRRSSDTFIAVGISDDKIFINCNGQPLEKLNLKNIGALEIKLSCSCQISYGVQVFRPTEECDNDPPTVRHILPLQWKLNSSMKSSNLTAELEENLILDGLEKEEDMKRYEYQTEGLYKEFQEERHNKEQQHNTADKQIYVEPTQTSSTGLVIQICFLWIFVVILLVTNICLIYHFYKIIQWKKVQMYKDTRIVYSVPASPQFPNKF